MKTTPYLFFGGRCEEAIAFYRDTLGAEVRAFVRFGDMPDTKPESAKRVMHAELAVGESTIYVSDGQSAGPESGFAISLETSSDEEAERLLALLADRGKIEVAMMKTPFASRFAMARDQFGIPWMITTAKRPA